MPVAANIYFHSSKLGSSDRLPVVFIHGAGGTHLNWPSEIRRLPDLRIFSIDLPGHGKSGTRGLQSIEAYAESILAWMEAIGLHRAVFMGHSMGGAIALTLARKHREHVLGLGLISTGARLQVDPLILENTASDQTFPTAISLIISKTFSEYAAARLIELATKRMFEIRPSVLQGDFIACNSFDLLEFLPLIKSPTLVICGQNDALTPLRYSQYLKDRIPGAQLQVIPAAGHMVMLEEPQKVAEAIRTFLSTIPFHPGRF